MKDYKKILKENNQEHLLKYIDMVNEEQRKNLIEEIGKIKEPIGTGSREDHGYAKTFTK